MRLIKVVACLCGCLLASRAQAAGPSVESVSPGIGQRGTQFELKFVGAGMSDSSEVLLYTPGVSCVQTRAASENELTVTLKAEADCPLGSHPFRVRTSEGLSELRIFRVTSLPIVAAKEPNESRTQAMPVTRNVTVTGVLEAGDVDCFELTLSKGERLAAEVEAVRLGENLLDTVLTVTGPDGKDLLEVDDTCLFGQDPFVTLVAPVDGKYVVRLTEAALEGDENSRYALHIGVFARPAFAFPPGGPTGQKVAVQFHGDAHGIIEREISLPATPSPNFGVFADENGLSAPTAIPFRVSPYRNVLEVEPNQEVAVQAAPPVEGPAAFNGILQQAGDIDRFRFRMHAGQRFQFEVFAQRLGSRADTLISILDNDGSVLVRNDDDATHDSRLVFQAPDSGEYQLQVTDKRGSGGADFFYRVEAEEPLPALTAFLPRPNRVSQERQTIAVPQGNRVMTFLAVRRQGVNGAVEVDLKDLPAGVVISGKTIAEKQSLIPIVIEATSSAPMAGSLAAVSATELRDDADLAKERVSGGFEQIVDLVSGTADTLYQSVTVDRLAVAVVEPAPFSIRLEEPKSALAQDGTLGLIVHVERTKGFSGPVDVTFPFLPPWVDGPAKLSIPGNQSSGVYVVHAFPQAKAGAWSLCAEGRRGLETNPDGERAEGPVTPAFRDRRRNRAKSDAVVSTQLITLNIAASPVQGSIACVAAEQGTKLKLTTSIEHNRALPGELIATLEGLPNRVAVGPVAIRANATSAEFVIELEGTAPLGTFNGLACRLTGKIEGQDVSYCIGRGGVLKIEPAGALVTDQSGRALSPLEVLRRSQQKTAAP